MPRFDHRFARQNGCGPPPEFPLASSYPGIVHHLSGPNIYALTRVFNWLKIGQWCPCILSCSHITLSLRARVCHSNTRTHVRLLGPCFKTGRLKPLRQVEPFHTVFRLESFMSLQAVTHCVQLGTRVEYKHTIPPPTHPIQPDYKTTEWTPFRPLLECIEVALTRGWLLEFLYSLRMACAHSN